MRNSPPMVQNTGTGDRVPLMFYHNAVVKCVIIYNLPSNSNPTCTFYYSQLAQQPQPTRIPQSPLTPTRQPQSVASTLPISGLIPEPTEMISPFKPSTPFESPRLNVPTQSPAEKLESVKQYLRDRSDQPLHHVEYVGLVSLLKDSVQGSCILLGRNFLRLMSSHR